MEAAEKFAVSSCKFEDVALKLLSASKPALMKFLELKIRQLSPGEHAQTILLTTWLLELILSFQNQPVPNVERPTLAEFFKSYKGKLHPETVYKVLASHGRQKDIVTFAESEKNWDMLLEHYIDQKLFDNAIDLISRIVLQTDSEYRPIYLPILPCFNSVCP
jgi:hypothetical protein